MLQRVNTLKILAGVGVLLMTSRSVSFSVQTVGIQYSIAITQNLLGYSTSCRGYNAPWWTSLKSSYLSAIQLLCAYIDIASVATAAENYYSIYYFFSPIVEL